MPLGAARTAISKSLGGRQATHPLVLAYLGLRRDPRTVAASATMPRRPHPSSHRRPASGEAGVAAAVALAAAALGRDS